MAAKRTKRSGLQYQIAFAGPIVLGAAALLFALISIFALHIPAFSVILFIVLEGLLAWLLNETPIYVPGIVAAVQVVAGILRGHVIFMILMALLYLGAYVVLQARMDYDTRALQRRKPRA